MQKTHIVAAVAIIVAVGAGSFYGGTVYEKKSIAKAISSRGGENNFRDGMQQGRQPGGQQRRPGMGGPNGMNGSGDFVNGEVISKDDKSITVKTRDGGSRIVFFSGSTSVGRTVDGSADDLTIGQQVMINGKASADGSLAAQNIQIRPDQK